MPAAGVLVDAYTVGNFRRADVEVGICNQGAATTVSLSHAIGGEADVVKHYKLSDFPLGAAESKITARFQLRAADVLRVKSVSGQVSFTVNGIEEDA